jgi:Asp-tRNA(Asn)/Glu-tRNA(Gln) amidotransferase A subunit family amidase
MPDYSFAKGHEIAAAVARGDVRAREVVEDALSVIRSRDQTLNAFTDVTAERALARADALDSDRAAGQPV